MKIGAFCIVFGSADITDLRVAHEAAHLGGGTSHGVAVKVDFDRRLAHGPSIAPLARGRVDACTTSRQRSNGAPGR
jgi:hypothetical protein